MAGYRKRTWTTPLGFEKSCWEITYSLDGKKYRKSGFKTKLDAQKAAPEITNQFDSNITFEKLANDYLNRHCEMHCKESTKELYESYLKVNLKQIQEKKVKDISTRDVNGIILDWRVNGLANKTINNVLIFLKSVFNYGVNNALISINPCAKIKKLPLESKEMNFLNEDEVKLFLDKAKAMTPQYYALFYTAIFTGMRRGELLAVEWNDIDFIKKTIAVNKQLYRRRVTSTKTNKSTRTISISDGLIEVLRQHKKDSAILSKIVFCTTKGEYLHAWSMAENHFKPVLKAVAKDLNEKDICNNLEKIRFHDLRHTYASLLLSKNVPIKYVQNQLGHSSCKVTLDTYAHVMPSVNERAINILDEININETKSEQEVSMANVKA